MTWSVNLPADLSKIRLSAGYIRGNNLAIQNVLSSSSLLGNFALFPFSTSPTPAPIFFYLDAAPSGWVIMAIPPTDALLAVKGGPVYVTGGTTVGTWVGPGHAIITTEVPRGNTGAVTSYLAFDPNSKPNIPAVAHSHDWTTTRPMASVGIFCVKLP